MAPKAKAAAGKADAKAKPKGEAKKAKKEKPEEEFERIEEPDKAAHEAKLAEVQTKIDALQKKKQAINDQFSKQNEGKDEFFKEKGLIKAELDEVYDKMSKIKAQREEISGKLGDKKVETQEAKAQLNKMKTSVTYKSEDEINERINTIEFKLQTESLSLKDEKAFLVEIKELKKTKPKLSQLSKLQDHVQNLDTGEDLWEKNRELGKLMTILYEQKLEIQGRLQQFVSKREQQTGDLKGVGEQKETIQKEIQELLSQRQVLKDSYKAEMDQFREKMAAQRKAKNEKYQEQRAQQQAEWDKMRAEREVEKLEVNPHLSQITLIDQTIAFCKGLMPQEKAEQKEEKKETSFNNKDGEIVLLKKEDRDEEFYYAPTKKKGPKKGKASSDSLSKKTIKHNAETFKLFDKLGLEAPVTAADVPALLEELDKQKLQFQEKVEAWDAQKEELKQKIMAGAKYEDLVTSEKKQEEKDEEKDEEKEEEKAESDKAEEDNEKEEEKAED